MKNLVSVFSLIAVTLLGLSSCTTRYYIVRHAEKQDGVTDAPAPNGPSLTAAGKLRAIALRDSLRDKNVTRIFVSQYLRTQLTADATASTLNIIPSEYQVNPDGNMENLAAQLRALDNNVLVVGHSNTVPKLIALLTGINVGTEPDGSIAHDDYDNFFIVKRHKGLGPVTYTLERRGTYGAVSPTP